MINFFIIIYSYILNPFIYNNSNQNTQYTKPYNISIPPETIIEEPNAKSIFGPLQLEMNRIKRFNNIYIIPALNEQNKRIFIALNCTHKIINVTGNKLIWKKWLKPKYKFESNIINKICS